IRERFVWARRKPDNIDADHDKRIAENYVFDEVLGHPVPRAEYEKRAKFNQDDCKPTPDEIRRFPSRINSVKSVSDYDNGASPSLPPELMKGVKFLKLKPSGSNITKSK
ncbi:molybdopterin-guanine dinucleotide biosynthesis protein MobA, partial [Salmonella enterica subsp. enterica serovar Newport str. CFSAN000835]